MDATDTQSLLYCRKTAIPVKFPSNLPIPYGPVSFTNRARKNAVAAKWVISTLCLQGF